ncbi:hypothetical protein SFRURICE_015811 [Spodoptera frugiperda]|uniref:SFRICE_022411 n=1 Tax=Spodoptera frugiperda TaxID=7108 RepID=A0A2H1WU71_SPOFR|nr:hypothetical protein SFRURICE_015811 [Spodoptera frugiperda]
MQVGVGARGWGERVAASAGLAHAYFAKASNNQGVTVSACALELEYSRSVHLILDAAGELCCAASAPTLPENKSPSQWFTMTAATPAKPPPPEKKKTKPKRRKRSQKKKQKENGQTAQFNYIMERPPFMEVEN